MWLLKSWQICTGGSFLISVPYTHIPSENQQFSHLFDIFVQTKLNKLLQEVKYLKFGITVVAISVFWSQNGLLFDLKIVRWIWLRTQRLF